MTLSRKMLHMALTKLAGYWFRPHEMVGKSV